MTPKGIFALCFLIISVALTIVSFTVLRKRKYGKFVGAASASYASGCFFILMLALFKENAPMAFVVLADSLISGIYLFTAIMLILVSKKLVDNKVD